VIAGTLEVEMFANIARLTNDMNQAKGVVGNSMTSVERSVESAKKVLATLGLGLSVGVLVNKFQQVAVETDKLRGNLVTVTGSTDAAGIAFDNLTKFAAKTPFTLDQSVNAFIKLKALGLDPSERALNSYGNTASAMGKSMSQMIEAVADAATNEFERLKEFGIKAKQQGDNVTFTFQGVSTTVKKNSEDIQQYLLDIGETKFGDAMANQMERLPGLLSNLEDNVDALFRKMADEGGTAIFGKGIKASSDAVALLTKNTDLIYDAVILLAGVMTARMVPALGKTTAAFIAGEIEAVRYQIALGRMAGVSASTALAQNALTSSVGAFRGALALVGGPIGATVLLLGGLAIAYKNVSDAQEQARKGAAKWIAGTGGLYELDLAIKSTENKIADLRKAIEEDDGIFSPFIGSKSNRARDEIKRLELFLESLRAEQNKLIESQTYLSEEMDGFIGPIRGVSTALPVLTATHSKLITELENEQKSLSLTSREQAMLAAELKAISDDAGPDVIAIVRRLAGENYDLKESADATKDAIKAFNDSIAQGVKEIKAKEKAVLTTIAALEREQLALGMTSRAQAIFNAVTDASANGALPAQIAQIAELTAKNYDVSESIKLVSKEIDYQKNMLENVQREWGDLIYQLVQGKSDFGDFFDSIAKGFARMVAEMAAADLAKAIFGGGGLGALTGGSVAGLITGGVGSVVSGGAGAATAGGVGAAISGGISSAVSGVTSAVSAIPGWGWALAGAAVLANKLDSGGTMSSNAGMLTQDLPAAAGRTFDVAPFASGADFTGFARREDQAAAVAVIDTFRAYDATLTGLANHLGITPQLKASDFVGLDEKGQGRGAFFGSADEQGGSSGLGVDQQLNSYVKQWLQMVGTQNGVDQATISEVTSKGTADAMIAYAGQKFAPDGYHANGLDYVPYDGYRAVLHKGERVQTAQERNSSMDQVVSELRALRSEFGRLKTDTKKTADILSRVTRDGNSLLTTAA